MRILPWFTLMAVPLLNSCSIQIHDFTACALAPGNNGAVCDDFLSSDQHTLTETQWQALQSTWNSQGQAVVCVQSQTIAQIKAEIEKACSSVNCSYQQVAQVLSGLKKIESMTHD